MARPDTDGNAEIQSMVFENLGVTQADLDADIAGSDGVDDSEGSADTDNSQGALDLGEQSEQRQPRQPRDQFGRERKRPRDDLSVSHTAQGPVKYDQRGNIVDTTGKVVARAGAEARLYTRSHNDRVALSRAQAEHTDLRGKFDQLITAATQVENENKAYKAQQQAIEQYGISPQDQLNAIQMYSELKANPIEGIKKILTRAVSRGITLESLGFGAGTPGTDPKALIDLVREEIGKATKPLQERTEAERRQQETLQQQTAQRQRAEQEVKTFFDTNPGASQYMPVFQQVIAQPQFAHMSLGEIWARIQLNLMQNHQSQNGASQRPSMNRPNGRGAPITGSSEFAPVKDSYDKVLNDVLNAAGVR